jgi:magnesium transporter
MLTFHPASRPAKECTELGACPALTEQSAWIDLLTPSVEEEHAVESALGIDVPTKDEMQDIATSSRLYQEGASLFMTATVLTKSDTSHPEASAVTFILTPARLITVRYAEPLAFANFRKRRDSNPAAFATGISVFHGLLDAVVERIADVLENVGAGLEHLSHEVFAAGTESNRGARDYKEMLTRLGRYSDLLSKARESLLSLARLSWFYQEADKSALVSHAEQPGLDAHMGTVSRDIASLNDHAAFLSGKVAFLLDATLGLINVEQNAIIKIVSVAAVVFLPPTLVASIYGMNFQHMPELAWPLGYPLALLMMVASAILPFYWFKRKGWL